ncbi:MAG: type II toxin-antitoxin system prevent-host-death family antitoxin [Coriobacteriales bacterium]|nr:type II toxin-antitoxin system prevent-host-death family antitoxin [Coriobacteriales bacterium]
MEVTVKELRSQPGRILSMVQSGRDITITMRGKPAAKIIPLDQAKCEVAEDDFFLGFGIWKDRDDMADSTAFVEKMRKGRDI